MSEKESRLIVSFHQDATGNKSNMLCCIDDGVMREKVAIVQHDYKVFISPNYNFTTYALRAIADFVENEKMKGGKQ